jgi:hypothetical protein
MAHTLAQHMTQIPMLLLQACHSSYPGCAHLEHALFHGLQAGNAADTP